MSISGHTLVLGPAGSGKTTLLRDRCAGLIRDGADPSRMIVMLPHRRAARATEDAIVRSLGRGVAGLPVTTWHQEALRIVGVHYARLGYPAPPKLLDAPEQFSLVREMLETDEERRRWRRAGAASSLVGFAEELRNFVLRAQALMLDPADLEARAAADGRPEIEAAAGFFRSYLARIDADNRVDHANVVTRAVKLLRESPEIERPRWIFADDLHDVTPGQADLLHALTGAGTEITAAANPDAHIFGFRGTSLEPVRTFTGRFHPTRVEELTAVHRGEPAAEAWAFEHLADEAEAIAHECRRLHVRDGIAWSDIAIVVRRHGEASRTIQRALSHAGVPYAVAGEGRAFARQPVLRPLLDLVRAAAEPEERGDLLPALLASPVGGMDAYAVRELRRQARLRGATLDVLLAAPPDDLAPELAEPLRAMRGLLDELAGMNRTMRADELFWEMWSRLDHFRDLVASGPDEDLDTVAAFARAVERYSSRDPSRRFADYLDVLRAEFGPEPWGMPADRTGDAVAVLTAHHAAGLEFDAVVVAGCVEGSFPDRSQRRPLFDIDALVAPATPAERLADRAEEERRLLAVACSRARRRLVLTGARRSGTGQRLVPSPMIESRGLSWAAPPAAEPLSAEEVEAAARRVLADRSRPEAERRAALATLAALPGVDPEAWWYQREWTDPGVPMAPEELRTSYSRLSTYENCPLQYLYQVELGLDPGQTHAMLVGVWIHDIIDLATRGEIELTIDALIAALDERWDPTIFEGRAVEHRRRLDCERMLRNWLEVDGKVQALASEVWFEYPIDGAVMRGKIDRVVRLGRSMVRLTDYKTARNYKSEGDIVEDLQLASYYLALKRDETLKELGEPKYLELAYPAIDFMREGFKRVGFDPTQRKGYAEEAEARLTGFVASIKAEDFRPSPSANCQWCAYKTLCPVWPEGDEVVL